MNSALLFWLSHRNRNVAKSNDFYLSEFWPNFPALSWNWYHADQISSEYGLCVCVCFMWCVYFVWCVFGFVCDHPR